MFKHYLTTALRHFNRHKATTVINVLCMWFGMLALTVAYGVATRYLYMDTLHEKSDRAYFVSQENRFAGNGSGPLPFAGFGVAPHLKAAYPELEEVARITLSRPTAVAANAAKQFARVSYADPGALNILDLNFVAGDRRAALAEPHSALIGEEFAKRLFGDADPMGQSLILNNKVTVHITGVVGRPKFATHINPSDNGQADFLNASIFADWTTVESLLDTARNNRIDTSNEYFDLMAFTYVLFKEQSSLTPDQLRSDLPSFAAKNIPTTRGRTILDLRPLTKMGQTIINMDMQTHRTGVSFTGLFLTVGILVLSIACLNYANFASAQATTRLKELALLRTIGASRAQIVAQAFTEAFLVTMSAFILLSASIPGVVIWYSNVTGPALDDGSISMFGQSFWAWILIVLVGAALLASVYPASILSRIRPAQALHSGRAPLSKRRVMRWIVVGQCVIATALLILATIMQAQNRSLFQSRQVASADRLISISNDIADAGVSRTQLQTELQRLPFVSMTSAIDSPPGASSPRRIVASTADPSARRWTLSGPAVDYDFFATMGIPLLAGRDFERGIASDLESDTASGNVIIDTRLAEKLGWRRPDEAIGKSIFVQGLGATGALAKPRTVIGVVPFEDIYPLSIGMDPARFYTLNPDRASTLIVRASKSNVAMTVAEIDKVWNELAPNVPIRRSFVDEQLTQAGRIFAGLTSISTALAVLALLIAMLGIVGIAIHTIGQRTFEIGMRKTLGARRTQVVGMLLKDFSKPLLIGNLIAWPVAFVLAKAYLTMFSNPIGVTPAPFAMSLVFGLVLAWIAVGRQSWRAASLKPADVLRHE